MFLKVIVENTLSDLSREYWEFILLDDKMILERYAASERATKRHGWKNVKYFNRLDQRHNTIKFDDVPKHPWVLDKAKKELMDQIKFDWGRG